MPIDEFGQPIPYGDPQGRTPQKPEGSVGVDIDNWLRRMLGGDLRTQAEEGRPTDVLGVLPQSPTFGAQPRPQTNVPLFPPDREVSTQFAGGELNLTGDEDLR